MKADYELTEVEVRKLKLVLADKKNDIQTTPTAKLGNSFKHEKAACAELAKNADLLTEQEVDYWDESKRQNGFAQGLVLKWLERNGYKVESGYCSAAVDLDSGYSVLMLLNPLGI